MFHRGRGGRGFCIIHSASRKRDITTAAIFRALKLHAACIDSRFREIASRFAFKLESTCHDYYIAPTEFFLPVSLFFPADLRFTPDVINTLRYVRADWWSSRIWWRSGGTLGRSFVSSLFPKYRNTLCFVFCIFALCIFCTVYFVFCIMYISYTYTYIILHYIVHI